MIGLVGIDVDGTLVGSSGKVPDAVWTAAQRARAVGIHLVLCSGRPAFGTALDYARHLEADGWHIFQNGASILNLGTQEARSSKLPEAVVKELIAKARQTNAILELYSDKDYVSESDSSWARDHADLLGVEFRARPFESLEGAVVRAQWLMTKPEAERFLQTSHPELEVAVSSSPLMSETAFVGMTRSGVSKGSAIRSVADACGVALQDVMYVGDADNDLAALRVVGHPVAMGNGSPSVLKIGSRVVGDVDDGGLAQALDQAAGSASQ